MTPLHLPQVLSGLSRRMLAAIVSLVLIAGGSLASWAATEFGGTTADPLPSASGVVAQASDPATSQVAASTPVPSPSPLVAASPAEAEAEAVTLSDNAGGAGGNNLVIINNFTDDSLRIRGSVQINRINAPNVAPQNLAQSFASCTDCETLAVALQINLISRTADRVVPANAAVAVNAGCSGCTTAARAIQYVISVDEPMRTPPEVRALYREMGAELRDIAQNAESFDEAWTRVEAVLADFRSLSESLRDDSEKVETATTTPDPPELVTPTPIPTASPSPSTTTDSPAPTSTVTVSPSATPPETPVPSP